ncbi:MAG TPA: DUF4097 family beta strand repeat-containing protein, partial [Frankiaceae bacterium]|nr:DUF4097 family beta strand repeat-containing protein [Frankiaceae bacterium]
MATSAGQGAPAPGRRRPQVPRRVQVGLLVLAVLAAAVALAGQIVRRTDRTTRAFPAVRAVELDSDAGDVAVVATARRDVRVTTTRVWSFRMPVERMRVEGDVLRLTGSCPGGLGAGRCAVAWQVQVPPGVALRVHTGGGDLTVRGVGGPLVLATDAGRVEVVDVAARRVELSSGAGDVRVATRRAPGRLVAQSRAGDIRLTLPDTVYRVDAHTDRGTARVAVH